MPDNWSKYGVFNGEIKKISDTARYKMAGNAVTSTVVKVIIENMLKSNH